MMRQVTTGSYLLDGNAGGVAESNACRNYKIVCRNAYYTTRAG